MYMKLKKIGNNYNYKATNDEKLIKEKESKKFSFINDLSLIFVIKEKGKNEKNIKTIRNE